MKPGQWWVPVRGGGVETTREGLVEEVACEVCLEGGVE